MCKVWVDPAAFEPTKGAHLTKPISVKVFFSSSESSPEKLGTTRQFI